jgi:Tfp pilus assembly protein PilV
MRTRRTFRSQRGTTLLEGLVAFLVLSLGMLSVVRVQTQMRVNSDVARQRSEAVRIAQEEVEKMRAFSTIAVRAGASAFASLTSGTVDVNASEPATANADYVLTREVSAGDVPASKNATVTVAWDDRTGTHQQVVLNTLIAGHDPAYSGALKLLAAPKPVRGVRSRSAWIPLDAKDLGNGSSAYKPVAGASEALLFDNASGNVSARCNGPDANTSNANLSIASLGTCEAMQGYLLSGVVRFSSAVPPDPAAANDVPLALSMSIALGTGASAPLCRTEARKTVSYSVAGATIVEGVAVTASPASVGVVAWAETGERYLAYHCVVAPAASSGAWAGRASVVPSGWAIGAAAGQRRVCRYSTDLDASGAIDNNLEHPDTYSAVTTSLTNQNFLVIAGHQACPVPPTATGVNGVFADLSTAPHQP